MKWIEIIKARSAGRNPERLKAFLSAIPRNGQSGLTRIRIYHHAAWETDWSLHLYWESKEMEPEGSGLALSLSQTLAEFGLVDYSAWIEEI